MNLPQPSPPRCAQVSAGWRGCRKSIGAIAVALHATNCLGAELVDVEVAPRDAALINTRVEAWPLMGGEAAPRAIIGGGVESHGLPALLDARLWTGGERISLGVGVGVVEQSARLASGRHSPFVIVGLRYRLSERSGSYVDSAPAIFVRDGRAVLGRAVRVGLEFKPARGNVLGLSRGTLLRMQLNTDSQLQLRLRGGGLRLMLRSQF